jgi:hypothetical protein
MAAIPNAEIDRAFSPDAEEAKQKVRALDKTGSDPLSKIGSSKESRPNDVFEGGKLFKFGLKTSKTNDQVRPAQKAQQLNSNNPLDGGTLFSFGINKTPRPRVDPQVSPQPLPAPAPKETSFLDDVLDVGTAISEGAQQTINRIGATGGAYTGNERVVVESAQYAKKLEDESEAVRLKEFKDSLSKIKRIDEKEAGLIDSVFYYVGEVAKTAYDNPAGTVQFVAEQLPNAATVLGAGFAGLKTGAAVGTVVNPGVGTVVGGTLGFIAGMFGGNTLIETGAKAQEKAADGTFHRARAV